MTRFRYPTFYATHGWTAWNENVWRTLNQFAFFLLNEYTSKRLPSTWCSFESVR